jgi:hypothetical protein
MTTVTPVVFNIQKASDGAYKALRQLFETYHDRSLEIEILPPAITPPDGHYFIQEDLSIGIPKKVLVSGFLRARDVFARRNQILAEQDDYEVRQAPIKANSS